MQPNITVCGTDAIAYALMTGATLYVKALDGRWLVGDGATLRRAMRMAPHSTWIYGVET